MLIALSPHQVEDPADRMLIHPRWWFRRHRLRRTVMAITIFALRLVKIPEAKEILFLRHSGFELRRYGQFARRHARS
jgi:hypothetical protein